VHGIGAGTDSNRLWAIFLYTSTAGVVLFLSLFRLLMAVKRPACFVAPGRDGGASLTHEQPLDQG
ncbi:MAG TPA: hypothetical protein VHA53_08190, partial [Nitrolancea sp.]|nr:hypothetical protein [Nitrolancea sp.]